ncbi:MAG: class I SAM-dependent methyltransferase [Candidatus Orphnella occulta]|nr:class I SAM-dependent methyltransferase [Candidatus Orphnella occulta]
MIPEKFKNFIKKHPLKPPFMDFFLSFHKGVSVLIKIMILMKRVFNIIDKETDAGKVMVNIGGGHYYKRHWKVLDFNSDHYNFQMALIDYNFDLTSRKPLPFKDGSVSFFYSSHTFEHIPQEYCKAILGEIFRSLKSGGIARFTMPDFNLAYEAFSRNHKGFFESISLGESIERSFLDFFAGYMKERVSNDKLRKDFSSMSREDFANFYVKDIPGDSQKKSVGSHISWWNYDKLKTMLEEAGFKNIYRSEKQQSAFPEMRGEGIYWGFDSTNPEVSFFAEAIK